MSDLTLIDQKEEENKTWVPRVITGGRPPTGNDWLSGLPVGTSFLVKKRDNSSPILENLQITFRSPEGNVRLYTSTNREEFFWVDPILWCLQWELKEVLVIFDKTIDE